MVTVSTEAKIQRALKNLSRALIDDVEGRFAIGEICLDLVHSYVLPMRVPAQATGVSVPTLRGYMDTAFFWGSDRIPDCKRWDRYSSTARTRTPLELAYAMKTDLMIHGDQAWREIHKFYLLEEHRLRAGRLNGENLRFRVRRAD